MGNPLADLILDAMKTDQRIRAEIGLAADEARPDYAAPAALAPTSPTKALVTLPAAARHFGSSESSFRRLLSEGMPCTYVGDRARFNLDAVAAWFAARGRKAAPVAPSQATVTAIASRAGLRVAKRKNGGEPPEAA